MPKRTVDTKFYTFDQNNSGGGFGKPAIHVIIEALNYEDANSRAEDIGLYFDGVASGNDCECCGDRWSSQWRDYKASETPKIYGQSPEVYVRDSKNIKWGDKTLPEIKVFFLDGTTKEYFKK